MPPSAVVFCGVRAPAARGFRAEPYCCKTPTGLEALTRSASQCTRSWFRVKAEACGPECGLAKHENRLRPEQSGMASPVRADSHLSAQPVAQPAREPYPAARPIHLFALLFAL